MHNFKKALGRTIAFLLCVIAATVVIVEPYFQRQTYYYQDAAVREELSGQLDYIICGSSHAFRSFVPEILDRDLGCNSYNLAGALMTMQGRYTLLKKEMERNPISTVVIELSFNALTRNRDEEGPEGDLYILGRSDNFFDRASYFLSAIRLNEYGRVYYDTLDRGITSWKHWMKGESEELIQYRTKGYSPLFSTDLTLTQEDYDGLHYSSSFDTRVYEENMEYLEKIFALCEENNAKVIMVTTPIAEINTCQYDNLDVFREWYEQLSQEHDCAFYDFNLLKNKDTLFPSATAFFDPLHLSESGAETFSTTFTDIIQRAEAGEDISNLFYNSYVEADAHSIHAQNHISS
ncbi:MAG: hypothetical protein ACOX7K_06075 [Oscillospiraceae bacterium]|jgi:hypothetical protein